MHIVTLAHTHIDLVPDLNAIGSWIKLRFDPEPKCDLVLDFNVLMHTVTLAHTHIDSVPDHRLLNTRTLKVKSWEN